MKTKHTPGPWTYDGENGLFSVMSNNEDEYGDIARINEYHERTNMTAQANAKLIAAAPELLEACVIALIHLETDEIEKGVQHTLKLAIQKATQ